MLISFLTIYHAKKEISVFIFKNALINSLYSLWRDLGAIVESRTQHIHRKNATLKFFEGAVNLL